jgi:amino acid transporter
MDVERDGRRRYRASAVGAWALVVTGAGHLALTAVITTRPETATRRAARQAMTDAHLTILGMDRTLWQSFRGFSLLMAVLAIGLGALNLLVLRRAPELVLASRAVLWLNLAVVVPALALSALLFWPPPILLLGIACAAFGYALTRPSSPTAPRTPDPGHTGDTLRGLAAGRVAGNGSQPSPSAVVPRMGD